MKQDHFSSPARIALTSFCNSFGTSLIVFLPLRIRSAYTFAIMLILLYPLSIHKLLQVPSVCWSVRQIRPPAVPSRCCSHCRSAECIHPAHRCIHGTDTLPRKFPFLPAVPPSECPCGRTPHRALLPAERQTPRFPAAITSS